MNISRRTFLKTVGIVAAGSASGCCTTSRTQPSPVLVNDVHTQLNPTFVRSVTPVRSLATLRRVIRQAASDGRPVSIAGGRHAAGGQQFATDVALGTPTSDQNLFSGNSKALVAKILHQHRCDDVELVQGDIITVPDAALPTPCSLVLLDVDLTEPTYVALKRFWPRTT